MQAGVEKSTNPEAYEQLDKLKCGVIVGSGMGGLTVFAEGTLLAGVLKIVVVAMS